MSDTYDAWFASMDKPPPDQAAATIAPKQSSNYDSWFALMDKAPVGATQNLLQAQGTNPDAAARAQALSKQNGVPQPTVEADLPGYEQQQKLKDNVDALDQHPGLAAFVASNPLAARMAQDDFDKLGFLEKTWDAIKSGTTSAFLQNQMGRLGNAKQIGDAVGMAMPGTDSQIQAINAQMQKQPHLVGAFGTVQSFTGFLAGLVDNGIQGAIPGAVAGGAVGAAGGAIATPELLGAGAAPGAVLGAPIGATIGFNADMARVAAGNAYLKMGQMRGLDGQPISESGRQFGALFTGVATYAIGKYATAVEGALMGETADALAGRALQQALEKPAFTTALAQYTKSTAVGAAQGAGVMTAMEGSSIIGEEIGKAFSDGHFEHSPHEIVERLADAALNGAIMLGTMHGAMHGMGLYGDYQAAQRADGNAAMFKNLMDGSAESKLRDRDQQAFQEFMQHQTNGTPVENLYIEAAKVREFYQSMGIDPALDNRASDPLFGFVKDMPQQLREAADTGGDVVIPSADYLTHLAGTPAADKLLPDLRVGANSMSVNEAKSFNEEAQTRLKAAADVASKADVSPTQGVFDDVKRQAIAAGYSEREAAMHAGVFASRYGARAERLGVDPMEAYKASGVEIQKGEKASADALQQESVFQPDETIEARRIQPPHGVKDKVKYQALVDRMTETGEWIGRPLLAYDFGNGGKFALTGSHRLAAAKEAGVDVPVKYVHESVENYKNKDGKYLQDVVGYGDEDVHAFLKNSGDKEASALMKAEIDSNENGTFKLNQATRGSIQLSDGKALISILANADHSTLIHESGHLWLDELSKDALIDGAPQQIKNDMATVMKWFGTDTIGVEQHEQFARAVEAYFMEGKAPSSALARVFSRFKTWLTKIYQNAKALNTPINDEIRGVFDRLLATDDEIEQAKATQGLVPAFKDKTEAGMTTAEWSAYTGAIDRANQKAESVMLEKAMASVRRQRTVEYKEEMKAAKEAAAVKIDQRPDIQALNLLTKGLLPDGTVEEHAKLSRGDIVKLYGEKGVTDLPKNTTAVDGVHPDYVAELLGFNSGDELVKSLQALEQQQRTIKLQEGEKRGIRQYLIDEEAKQQVEDKHGDLLNEASMQQEAMAAIHSDKQVELLATELRYLRRMGAQELVERGQGRKAVSQAEQQAKWDAALADFNAKLDLAKKEGKAKDVIDNLKQKIADMQDTIKQAKAKESYVKGALRDSTAITRPMLDAVRAHVETMLEDKTVSDIGNYDKYTRDERKAAREVQDAILKKDWNTAAAAKQRQILANVLYVKAKAASDQIDTGKRELSYLASKKSFKNISQEYTNQIHDLIGRFGFDSGRGEELQRVKDGTLQEFVEKKSAEEGIELAVDQSLYNAAGGALSNMKLSEFRALSLAVRSMREIGAGDKVYIVDGEKREFSQVKNQVVDAIRALGDRKQTAYLNPDSAPFAERKINAIKTMGRGIDAALTKKEALFDQIDLGDSNGIMNSAIFRKLKDAVHNRDAWSEDTAKDFKEAAEAAGKDWLKGLREYVPDDPALLDPKTKIPFKMMRKDMLGMMLNWGNQGNKDRLTKGYQWTDGNVKAFFDRNATKDDWDFVKKVWNAYNKYKAPLDALQVRATGVGLDMVHAEAFDTPHGRYEGGYYPVVEDKSRSYRAEDNAGRNAQSMFTNNYARATTPHGNTISRIGGDRPISIDLDIAPWKIGQTIHDIAMREALMDADRLLSHPDVKSAMDDVFGPEYRKSLRPWLQTMANSRNIDDAALGTWNRILSVARTNTVIVGIGFRPMTMIKHATTALSNSVSELGAKWMLAGTKEFYGPGMAEKWDFIKSKSPDMAYRLKHYDQDVNGQYANLFKDSAYTKFQQQAQYFSHIGISYLDLGSAAPTWLGAYRKALSEGMADDDAIYSADKVVRNAHGGTGLTDRSAIQETKGAWSAATMFYSFFNHIYNRQRQIVIGAAHGVSGLKAGEYKSATRNFAGVLARSWYYVAVPAFIEALAQSGGPNQDKEESWAGWAAKAIMSEIPAGIPVLRDIAKAAIEGRDYEMSPIAKAINTVIKTGQDAYKSSTEDAPANAGQHIAETIGYLGGLPTAAPFTAGKFIWDYSNGDVDPKDLSDWMQGLLHGKLLEK